jgi:hypothetical protein
MYNVNGTKAIKIRVVNDNEDARVEAEVEDDSDISFSPPFFDSAHSPRERYVSNKH